MVGGFDVEDESVLASVFKDSFPDSWRDNADFAQYLAELSSYGLDKLSHEPDHLAEERHQILEQTQNLAFHNYKTFIQTAECSHDIFQDFQIIEQYVDSMLEKLPELSTECQQFVQHAKEINTSRRMNNMTLERHTQLLEILEIPQLMDTCVRNGYYDEALELAAYVKRLEKKHSNIPVIVNIVTEVKGSAQLMLNQLTQQLRSSIQLPACLRIIGYLRRMDVFTEAELRIKFLQARDSWFQGILKGLPRNDPYYHITKTIEASRVHLFDIITQYRAIFSDEDPLLSTSKEEGPNEGALFHSWVIQKVTQFLQTLEADLQQGVGGRLDSLLGQSMYFGLSFSRVGADFRTMLAPIFQRAALSGFIYAVNEATVRFEDSLQSYTMLGPSTVMAGSSYSLYAQGDDTLAPPMVLLEHQPLAAYCNNLLSALNELRLCAPLSLACDVAEQLQDSLQSAVRIILDYQRSEEATFNSQERENFGRFCVVFATDLVPYINRCLRSLFPAKQLAQVLGISITELTKMGNVGLIGITDMLEPMACLLPKAQENNNMVNMIGSPVSEPTAESEEVTPSAANEGMNDVTPALADSDQSEATVSEAPGDEIVHKGELGEGKMEGVMSGNDPTELTLDIDNEAVVDSTKSLSQSSSEVDNPLSNEDGIEGTDLTITEGTDLTITDAEPSNHSDLPN